VYQGDETVGGGSANAIFPNGSPSRCYGQWACPNFCSETPKWSPTSNYLSLIGPGDEPCLPGYVDPPDPSHYNTTNIGGGLEVAGNELSTDQRQDVLWVVILLTDGVPNAGHNGDTYFCPQDTWSLLPRCNHGDPTHLMHAPPEYPLEYDALDYAYDMADFVGKPYPNGQNALLYTIGLGSEVDNPLYKTNIPVDFVDVNNTDFAHYPFSTGESLGRIFLNYAAAVGRGSAFYAATGSDLDKIFTLIGSNIATRISQ
jgi:hypothetical protein